MRQVNFTFSISEDALDRMRKGLRVQGSLGMAEPFDTIGNFRQYARNRQVSGYRSMKTAHSRVSVSPVMTTVTFQLDRNLTTQEKLAILHREFGEAAEILERLDDMNYDEISTY